MSLIAERNFYPEIFFDFWCRMSPIIGSMGLYLPGLKRQWCRICIWNETRLLIENRHFHFYHFPFKQLPFLDRIYFDLSVLVLGILLCNLFLTLVDDLLAKISCQYPSGKNVCSRFIFLSVAKDYDTLLPTFVIRLFCTKCSHHADVYFTTTVRISFRETCWHVEVEFVLRFALSSHISYLYKWYKFHHRIYLLVSFLRSHLV